MAGYYVSLNDPTAPLLTDQAGSDLVNLIFFSLAIRKGSWFQNPELGSRLHLLRKEKCLPRTEQLLKDYVAEALQWLLDTGRIVSFETVTVRVPASGRINYTVSVIGSDREPVTYSNFVRVV